MDRLDTTTLISASRRGDDQAKAELVGRFRSYLRLLANIHVKPLLQAKFDESDIVQETCLQAALSFDQFRSAYCWLLCKCCVMVTDSLENNRDEYHQQTSLKRIFF